MMLWHNLKKAVLSWEPQNIDKLQQICGEGWSKFVKSFIRSYRKCLVEVLLLKKDIQLKALFMLSILHCDLFNKNDNYNCLCIIS